MQEIKVCSQVSGKGKLYFTGGLVLVALLCSSDLYRWLILGQYQPTELLLLMALLAIGLTRVGFKYCYYANDKGLRIEKKSLLGMQSYEVSYTAVQGIYRYQAQLISVRSFRRTWRLHSALDTQEVWTIVYLAQGKKGKTENCRIYFKPGKEMLAFLTEKIPARVRSKEAELASETCKANN